MTAAAGATAGYHHRWWVSLPTMPHQSVSAVKYPISGTLLVSLALMEGFFYPSFSWQRAFPISERGKYLIPSGTVMTNPAVVGTLEDRPMTQFIWTRPCWRRPSPRHTVASRCVWNEACHNDIFLFLSQTTSFEIYNLIWSTNLV